MSYVHTFFCGCEWKLDPGKTCPTHGQARKYIRFECPQCGAIEVTNDQGGEIKKITRKTLCRKCQWLKKKQQSRDARLVKKPRIEKKGKAPITHPDCKWYLKKCLPAICKNIHAKCVDCTGCNKYEKEELRLEDYIDCNTDILSDAANSFNIVTNIRR